MESKTETGGRFHEKLRGKWMEEIKEDKKELAFGTRKSPAGLQFLLALDC